MISGSKKSRVLRVEYQGNEREEARVLKPKKEMEKVENLTTMADTKVDLDLANSSAHRQVENQDEARKSSVEQEMER